MHSHASNRLDEEDKPNFTYTETMSQAPNDKWPALFYQSLIESELEPFIGQFSQLINDWLKVNAAQKDNVRLSKQMAQLPSIGDFQYEESAKSELAYSLCMGDKVKISALDPNKNNVSLFANKQAKTESVLRQFMPWRKGPFSFFDIDIDTEWRSDWKWKRVLPHIGDLSSQQILDVGCGSGYHLFRMFEQQAKQVIGIDPTSLFFYQFQCFKRYFPSMPVHYLPIGIEQMPETQAFNTVFSMGVLYHRHDPIKFLKELKAQLAPKGQLVLETLVVDGDETCVLMPEDRYAQMRNVWYLPSVDALSLWLRRVGFKEVRCVDLDVTSIDEQRATPWMQGQSLRDFLDPADSSKTIEGYQSPTRAVFIAK